MKSKQQKLFTCLVIFSCFCNQAVYSQNYLQNFGLQQPQDPETFPVSRSQSVQPVPKEKENIPAISDT